MGAFGAFYCITIVILHVIAEVGGSGIFTKKSGGLVALCAETSANCVHVICKLPYIGMLLGI